VSGGYDHALENLHGAAAQAASFDLRDARSYSHFLVAFVLAAFIAARLAQ